MKAKIAVDAVGTRVARRAIKLLDLPSEIRNQIYELVLAPTPRPNLVGRKPWKSSRGYGSSCTAPPYRFEHVAPATIDSGAVKGAPSLARVCRKTRTEVLPMFLATIPIKDCTIRHVVQNLNFTSLMSTISLLPPKFRSQLATLPVLEIDLVLDGDLKNSKQATGSVCEWFTFCAQTSRLWPDNDNPYELTVARPNTIRFVELGEEVSRVAERVAEKDGPRLHKLTSQRWSHA
jgi:hypothetical protein